MGLVDYETDVEDEHNNNGARRLWVPIAKGVEIAQDQPSGSRWKSGKQATYTTASPIIPHGPDHSDGISDPMFLKGDIWKKTPGEVDTNDMIVGGVTRKIISMDLAMERGLICKKKLESLQKQNLNDVRDTRRTVHNDVWDSPRTVQEASLNAKNVGIKRQSSPTNLFPSLQQHATQSYTQLPPPNQEVIRMCEECNVPCSGPMNLEMHYRGKKHKARLEELKQGKDALSSKTTPLKCSLCNVPCMNERNLQDHLVGKKHAASLQAINAASKGNRGEGFKL